MRLSRDIVTVLYQFTSKCGQIRELLWEYGSSCFLHCSLRSLSALPLLERCFLSELLWMEHVRDKRFMWHSGILKKLETLLLVGQIQSPLEPEQMLTAWRKKNLPSPSLSLLHTSFPHSFVYVSESTRSPFITMGTSVIFNVFAKLLLPFFFQSGICLQYTEKIYLLLQISDRLSGGFKLL